MITIDLPAQNFRIAKGQDWPLEITVFGPEKEIKLAGDAIAGATTLVVEADHPALADGDMFQFGEHVVVEVSGAVAAGATSVTVEALDGPLQRGEKGLLLRDLTSATIEFEALANSGDATPAISKTGGDIVLLTQSARATRGHVQVNGLAADTSSLEAGPLTWHLWRRNSGTSRPIARGTLTIEEQGFLS